MVDRVPPEFVELINDKGCEKQTDVHCLSAEEGLGGRCVTQCFFTIVAHVMRVGAGALHVR